MPACDNRFLEVLFFDGDAAGGIHVTQDAILGPDEVRVRIEAGVEESNRDTRPAKFGLAWTRRGVGRSRFSSREYTGNGVSSSAWREVRLRASMAFSTAS